MSNPLKGKDFLVTSDFKKRELDQIVDIARLVPGVMGAGLTGAGFGGCTVQLVAAAQAQDFSRILCEEYGRVTGRLAEVMITKPAQGAQILRRPG